MATQDATRGAEKVLTRTGIEGAGTGELERLAAEIAGELERRRAEEELDGRGSGAADAVEEHVTPRGTYRWEMVECGHSDRCKKCKSGERHGPYLYRYFYRDGRQRSEYIKLSEAWAMGFERPARPAVAGGR